MLGIKIIKSATKNELVVPDGRSFDLNDRKNLHLVTAFLQQYLEVNNFFKKAETNAI